jgi:hypothetical protein
MIILAIPLSFHPNPSLSKIDLTTVGELVIFLPIIAKVLNT